VPDRDVVGAVEGPGSERSPTAFGASRNYGYDRARVPLTLGDLLPERSCGLESCDNFDAEVGGGPADEGLARAPSQSVEDLLA